MRDCPTRRRFIRGGVGLVSAGILAGCSGGDGGETPTNTDTASATATVTESATPSETPTEASTPSPTPEPTTRPPPPSVDEYLGGAKNFDGTVEDLRDQDAVTVKVGAKEGYAFAPAAIRISPGTTVTWEWTGQGGGHDVVANDFSFRSDFQVEEGATFEQTFDSAGRWPYYCSPHLRFGMKGYVIVEA